MEDAKTTASGIAAQARKAGTYSDIAIAQAWAGDKRGAGKTLESVRSIVSKIGDAKEKALLQTRIAFVQVLVGNLVGARKTLESAKRAASEIADADTKAAIFGDIVEVQVRAGDIEGGMIAASSIERAFYKTTVYVEIAYAQMAAKDAPGAQKTLELAEAAASNVPDIQERAFACKRIARCRAKAGDKAGAIRILALAKKPLSGTDEESEYGKALAFKGIASTQVQLGDLVGLRKWVESLDDSFQKTYVCLGAAGGLLAQQANRHRASQPSTRSSK